MQKGNLRSTCSDSGSLVDQLNIFGLEFGQGLFNIFHTEGYMLKSLPSLFDEFGYGTIGGSGFKKLYLTFTYRKKCGGYLLLGNSLGSFELKSQNLGPEIFSIINTINSNTKMVNFQNLHSFSPRCFMIYCLSSACFLSQKSCLPFYLPCIFDCG